MYIQAQQEVLKIFLKFRLFCTGFALFKKKGGEGEGEGEGEGYQKGGGSIRKGGLDPFAHYELFLFSKVGLTKSKSKPSSFSLLSVVFQ